VQNDWGVYTEKPDISGPPVIFAVADSADAVTVQFLKAPADYTVFSVYEDGKKLAGKAAKGKTDTQVIITLTEKISDPAKLVTVRDESGVFAEKEVTMRNILDSFYYGGDDLGLSYNPGRSAFKVWAPTAASVSLALYDDNETENLFPMEKDRRTGVWSVTVNGNVAGKYYLYRVEFAGGRVSWAVDPYATAVSANGKRGAVVNLAETDPPGWKPGVKPAFSGAWQDAVIYGGGLCRLAGRGDLRTSRAGFFH